MRILLLIGTLWMASGHVWGQGCCSGPGGGFGGAGGGPGGGSGGASEKVTIVVMGSSKGYDASDPVEFKINGLSTKVKEPSQDFCDWWTSAPELRTTVSLGQIYTLSVSGQAKHWAASIGFDETGYEVEWFSLPYGTRSIAGSCVSEVTGKAAFRIIQSCQEGSGSEDPAYDDSDEESLDSVHWSFDLGGRLPDGNASGTFSLHLQALGENAYQKHHLQFVSAGSAAYVSQITPPTGDPADEPRWQVVTPEWLVNIQDNTGTGGYDLTLYHRSQTTLAGTYYNANSGQNPVVTWSLQDPDVAAGPSPYNRLKLVKTRDGLVKTWLFEDNLAEAPSTRVWTLTEEPNQSVKRITTKTTVFETITTPSGAVGTRRDETTVVKDGASNPVSLLIERFEDRVVRDPADPLGLAQLTNTFFVAKIFSKEWVSGAVGSEIFREWKYHYYEDYFDLENNPIYSYEYGRLKAVVHPDGRWDRYEYEPENGSTSGFTRKERVFERWLNISPEDFNLATRANAKCTERTYVKNGDMRVPQILAKEEVTLPSAALGGYSVISRSEQDIGLSEAPGLPATNPVFVLVRTNRVAFREAANSAEPDGVVTNITYTYGLGEGSPYAGRVSARLMPEGWSETNQFTMGTFNPTTFAFTPAANGTYLRIYSDKMKWFWNGDNESGYSPILESIEGRSTRVESVFDPAGRLRVEREYVFSASPNPYTLLNEKRFTLDALDRVTTVTLNGRPLMTVAYSANRVSSRSDEDGTQISFGPYDALGRLLTETKTGVSVSGQYAAQAAIATTRTYDTLDRVLTTTTTASGLSLSRAVTYDRVGRVLTITDPNGLTTTYVYQNSNNPLDGIATVNTVTRPDTGTEISTYYLDGQLKSVTGTGDTARYYQHSLVAETIPGSATQYYVLQEKEFGGVDNGPRYRIRQYDWTGREFRTLKPAYSTSGTNIFVSQNTYDERGLLVRKDRQGFAPALYEYDEVGTLIASGLDLNSVPGLNLLTAQEPTQDRIVLYSEGFESDNGIYYYIQRVYQLQSNTADTPTLVRERRRQITGLSATQKSRQLTFDALNQPIESIVEVDSANRLVTYKRKLPTSNLYATRVVRNGLPMTESSDTVSTLRKWGYDALGRTVTTTEANGAVTTTSYVTGKNQVAWVQDHFGNRTTYTYAANNAVGAGMRLTETYADNSVKRREYDVQGRVIREWGNSTYPLQYEYDTTYGDYKKLYTYRDGTGWDTSTTWPATGTPQITEWVYQAKTGLLTEKRDAQAQATKYTYYDTADYRLKDRQWARTAGSPDVSYSYDSGTGELLTIDYAATGAAYTDIVRSYDRVGRLKQVTDQAGTRTLTYSALDRLDLETFTAGQFSGINVDRGFDGFGRLNSLAGSGQFTSLGFSYRTEGRLDQVTSGTMNWTYSYESASDRISQVLSKDGTTTMLTRSMGYDVLGRLSHIEETFTDSQGAVQRLFSGYSYDSMHRRRQRTVEDGSSWSYAYNDRGEVTSGKRLRPDLDLVGGQQFEYGYDNIGNRLIARMGGDAAGNNLRTETYTTSPSGLNQYTNRSQSAAVDVVGAAYANVTVTVTANGTPVTAARQGEYFYQAATIGLASTPVSNQVSVVTSAGGTPTVGAVYRPPLTQYFTHDLDGNLVSDGLWNYTWDAENRISVMSMSGLAVGAPRFQLEFAYDYLGRRIRKTTRARLDDSSGWVVRADVRYLYDGWNLLAELDALASNTTIRSYVWGLDLSGTSQGAGGVGGALGVRLAAGGTTYLYAYDGNGDVVGLMDTAVNNLSWAAQYEYGPFGEMIRSSGTLAKSNPLRFSTKYQDNESELLYYGYRFYNASTGRWPSRDPIQEKGGLNLYRFVHNDCVNRFDRLGLVDGNSTVEEIEAEVRRLIRDARDMGWTVGPDMLQNYINGGGDQVLPVSWLRSFSKVRAAEQKNQVRFQQSLEKIAKGMKCGETKTFHDYWDAQISYGGRGFSFDELFFASGDSTLTSTGDFTLTKNCCMRSYSRRSSNINCEETVVIGAVNHHWHDIYDFHPGMGVYIPGHGSIPDAALDKLRTQGKAKIFNMSSDWQQTLSGFIDTCPFYHATWRWQGP